MKACLAIISILLSFTILVFLLNTGYATGQDHKWTIIPSSRVGTITRQSTKAEVKELYGENNITSCPISVGEGRVKQGLCVFGGKKNELLIEWKKNGTPKRITIFGMNTDWKTKSGITVGTSLDKVEEVNGKPFLLTGFGWDYAGRTVSWEDGLLPSELQLEFEPSTTLPQEKDRQVMGDQKIRSDYTIIQKKGLKVETMFIRW